MKDKRQLQVVVLLRGHETVHFEKPQGVIARSVSGMHTGVPAFVPQGRTSRRQALRHAGVVSCVGG
jgi:hypothetical protein